jgi:hypothetical protein
MTSFKKTFALVITTALVIPGLSSAAKKPVATAAKKNVVTVGSIKALCDRYTPAKHVGSFRDLNPPAKSADGVNLPATDLTLFRSIAYGNPLFNEAKIMRGILGEEGWIISSAMHWTMSQVLTKHKPLNEAFYAPGGMPYPMTDYLKFRGILDDVNTLLACKADGYSQRDADLLAKDLMDKYFNNLDASTTAKRYFDMKDPDYDTEASMRMGVGNNAADLVATSYYDQISAQYGGKTLVLKDTYHRGIDLGYWNKAHNGYFWKYWADNGEIDIPGYVLPEDLIGFQERENDHRSTIAWFGRNRINFALYKLTFKGRNYVAVVDGESNDCMMQDPASQKVYFCKQNFNANNIQPLMPTPEASSKQAPLMGIIGACADAAGTQCEIPRELFANYGELTNQQVPSHLIDSMNSAPVNGLKMVFLSSADSKKAPQSVVHVDSASFGATDVTSAAAGFADGKVSVTYKISHRYLNMAAPNTTDSFKITWTCTITGKSQSLEIQAPAEGKTFEMKCGS